MRKANVGAESAGTSCIAPPSAGLGGGDADEFDGTVSIFSSACSVAKKVVKNSHSTNAAMVRSDIAAKILPKWRGMR